MEQPTIIDKIPQRSTEDYLNKGRKELTNHLRTELAKDKGKTRRAKFSDFLSKRIWSWVYHYFKSRFGVKVKYRAYSGGETGIYKLKKSEEATSQYINIAITSDWATDTPESFLVCQQMKKHNPDYTIHVGDTYFVGAPHEIKKNFVRPNSPWIRGNIGSFAVMGNHEMYARGEAFFEHLLPTLGIKTPDGKYDGQKTGFFVLENDYWRIFGLDTGYHSVGKPIIELLPFFAPKAEFDKIIIDWLNDVVKLGDANDKRGIVILTHHQFLTAFNKEGEYKTPGNQLASIIKNDRKILWLWGHEHKLSVFAKAKIKGGLFAYGRCIGHGGTPVEIESATFKKSSKKYGFDKLVVTDARKKKVIKNVPIGYNGYAVLKIRDNELKVEYYDQDNFLFSEKWIADTATGDIKGKIEVPADCPLNHEPGKNWDDACNE